MIQRAREGSLKKNRRSKPFYEKYAYHLVIGAFVLIIGYALIHSLWKTAPNIHTTLVNDNAFIASINDAGHSFKVAANPKFDVRLPPFRALSWLTSSHSTTSRHLISNSCTSA